MVSIPLILLPLALLGFMLFGLRGAIGGSVVAVAGILAFASHYDFQNEKARACDIIWSKGLLSAPSQAIVGGGEVLYSDCGFSQLQMENRLVDIRAELQAMQKRDKRQEEYRQRRETERLQ